MSVLLVVIALVALVFVVIAAVGVFLVMRSDPPGTRERLDAARTARQAPERATDVAFFFRFDGDDARYATEAIEAHGGRPLGPIQTREATLDLTRIAADATHAYLGPCAWPPVKCQSPAHGGVILGFRARTRVPLDTVSDDRQLTDVVATLRTISALPDAQILGGVLHEAHHSSDPDAPALVPVDGGALPGKRPCPSCGQPIDSFATKCEHCGSRAMR